MRFYLLTAEEARKSGDTWRIMPDVPLRTLMERGPAVMMPMTGEELELRLLDGQILTAHIVTFGMGVWQDSEGNWRTDRDPSDPALTLTITCDSTVAEIPPGTEVWLPNAKTESATDESS
jgi:hypothetical protein